MNEERILAGVDAGHIHTKAVIMRGGEILGVHTVPTGFDAVAAALAALRGASEKAGIPPEETEGVAATGIFKDLTGEMPLKILKSVNEVEADAKGALFLNKNSRTVIDIGGNIHKAIRYDQEGNLLDVIQNDKCAEGLGIFCTSIAKAMGMREQELSDLALKSTRRLSVGIQCVLSAESEAIDLMCQGNDLADVADAVWRFMVDRVAAMCSTMSLSKEIVVAGGLAKSRALMKHLPGFMKEDVSVLNLPEYVGAIGAVVSYGGGK